MYQRPRSAPRHARLSGTSRAWLAQATALALLLRSSSLAAAPPGAPPPARPPSVAPTSAASPSAPAPAAQPTPAAQTDAPSAEAVAEALAHFNKGKALAAKEAWSEALSEFLASHAIYPTKTSIANAAACLQALQRYDEALEQYDLLRREFPSLPPDLSAEVARRTAEIDAFAGTVIVQSAEPGSSIIIDGRFRGLAPLSGPLRVGLGRHEVRAYKPGSDPFGATVEVGPKEQVIVRVTSLSTGGRLRVLEQRGRSLDVVVDGTVVGKTPWEGSLAVGEHLVLLRGNVKLDTIIAECTPDGKKRSAAASEVSVELGTQPVRVPVRLREVTPLTLTAEELDTSLRVEPTPAGATVAIDSVTVGRGVFEGRMRVGTHTVEVIADGFVSERRVITLERRRPEVLSIELERSSVITGKPGSLVPAGVAFGVGALGLGLFAVTGTLAVKGITDVRGRCEGGTICPDAEDANVARAQALGKASTAGLVVGALGLAAGTVLVIVRPAKSDSAPRPKGPARARVDAVVGLGAVSLRGSFE